MDEKLRELADAIRARNRTDATIADIIGRPPEKGHIGEFIASCVFNIALEESAAHRGSDGHFQDEPLRGRSVNVKLYGKQEGLLDINKVTPPDLYLVLAGPRSAATSSRGLKRPLVIESVHLFDVSTLIDQLGQRGVKIGTATSVAREYWEAAELWPQASCKLLRLTEVQRASLSLFSA